MIPDIFLHIVYMVKLKYHEIASNQKYLQVVKPTGRFLLVFVASRHRTAAPRSASRNAAAKPSGAPPSARTEVSGDKANQLRRLKCSTKQANLVVAIIWEIKNKLQLFCSVFCWYVEIWVIYGEYHVDISVCLHVVWWCNVSQWLWGSSSKPNGDLCQRSTGGVKGKAGEETQTTSRWFFISMTDPKSTTNWAGTMPKQTKIPTELMIL